MKIILDIPENTKAMVITAFVDEVFRFAMETKHIGTAELKEGAYFKMDLTKDIREEV